jgi:hypothetical protein
MRTPDVRQLGLLHSGSFVHVNQGVEAWVELPYPRQIAENDLRGGALSFGDRAS